MECAHLCYISCEELYAWFATPTTPPTRTRIYNRATASSLAIATTATGLAENLRSLRIRKASERGPAARPAERRRVEWYSEGRIKRPSFDLQQKLMLITGHVPLIDDTAKEGLVHWLNQQFSNAQFLRPQQGVDADIGREFDELRRDVKKLLKDQSKLNPKEKENAAELGKLMGVITIPP